MSRIHNVDLFCQVIDNYGDIGVCWRLARMLTHDHNKAVTIWVDDLASFARICREVDLDACIQSVQKVRIAQWRDNFSHWPEITADIVIEAFGCRLPENYVKRMAECRAPPVWINLEYLSAELWVEGCHALVSPHPSLPLKKYFFFPGFTQRTGGLLVEDHLSEMRDGFRMTHTRANAFIAALINRPVESSDLLISLFCYANFPVHALLSAWAAHSRPITCLVPEGVASEAISRWLGQAAFAGKSSQIGALSLHVIPFVDQQDYDKILWSCDLNIVRGEDSFVRAQWAQCPFLWNVYPQEDQAHHAKLDAFLDRYLAALDSRDADKVKAIFASCNSVGNSPSPHEWWPVLSGLLPTLGVHGRHWAEQLSANGNLASKLIDFAEKIG